MINNIENALRKFLFKYSEVDLLEVMIDTGAGKENISLERGGMNITPYLNLWACNIFEGESFFDAMKEVSEHDDWGFLEDITDQVGSNSFNISLTEFYPNWPEQVKQGDNKVIKLLGKNAKYLSNDTIFIFHHVWDWPAIDIRTGQELYIPM
ncbi:hypothetical protein [Spartinivicinus poritis]|uniref:Uncharacterized protein n=1 Tax=Spartinivicinus poritis TaxID=2994640 RepID=A0ABT5UGI6_9GAMM|nr:hypothetical protein [Spartinivicinus sp. A2-2]MDE1465506.1 hypothetical protein [Spartinivicinus sp. A2-2]